MRLRFTLTLVTLALSSVALAQESKLPSYGSLDDIKTLHKVYVAAEDSESRERILKSLSKYNGLEVVSSPDDAEFFIEYGVLSRESLGNASLIEKDRKVKAQLRAYRNVPDKGRVIAWAKTNERETEHFMGMKMYDSGRGENELTKDFIKALKKARGEK
jgi:hypothetical protein